MYFFAIYFLWGVCSVFLLPTIPVLLPFEILLFIGSLIFLCLPARSYRSALLCILCLLAGFLWVFWQCQQTLAWTLPKNLEHQPVWIQGEIVELPTSEKGLISTVLKISRFNESSVDTMIRLDWYPAKNHSLSPLEVGQKWWLLVKLKRPHNLANPGSYDEEKFLFSKKIRATGYVLNDPNNRCIENVKHSEWINQIRAHIREFIYQHLNAHTLASMIVALSIGDNTGIQPSQWQVLQKTGTNHLMAISGVHVGLVSGLIYFLMKWCWPRIPRAALWVAGPRVAALSALISACIYSALAGFAVPTQRALLMLAVFLGSQFFRYQLLPWSGIAIATFLVLLINPLVVLSTSFWLSFGVVAGLIYGLGGRLRQGNFFYQHSRMQWVSSLASIPLTLLFFSNASFIAPLANAIAIPLVGLITVPLSLLGSGLSFIWPTLASGILHLAYWSLAGTWWFLSFLASEPHFSWQHTTDLLVCVSALFGIVLLLAPAGFPARYLSMIFFLPLFFPAVPSVPTNTFQITLLEVGQGLSTVIRTHKHVLVFDTGPKFSADYDMGTAVLVPYLQTQGIHQVDTLMISHGDNDHIGGAQSLLNAMPVKQILTSVPERFFQKAQLCLQGQHWEWDGVNFDVLYPDQAHLHLDNNSSCVLRISLGQEAVLLTGDIEKKSEKVILSGNQFLQSTILVAPHHGSDTSSSPDFIAAVHPRYVLFPTGYFNRFGFPKPDIVARYEKIGAMPLNVAETGAITFSVSPHSVSQPLIYRDQSHFIWLWLVK